MGASKTCLSVPQYSPGEKIEVSKDEWPPPSPYIRNKGFPKNNIKKHPLWFRAYVAILKWLNGGK